MPNRKEVTFHYLVPTYPDHPEDDPVIIETDILQERNWFEKLLKKPFVKSTQITRSTRGQVFPQTKTSQEPSF